MHFVNERAGQDGVRISGTEDRVIVDGTSAQRSAHTTVRFPSVDISDFDAPEKALLRLDFGAMAENVDGRTEPDRSSAYTLFVRQYDDAGALIAATRDRVRFFAGPIGRRIVLAFACEATAARLELALYQARDQLERITIYGLKYIFGRYHYRRDGSRLVRMGDVTSAGRWTQSGSRVEFSSFWGNFWAEMPDGWDLSRVHPNCRIAAEYLLVHNINRQFLSVEDGARRFYDPPFGEARPAGPGVLLSFSAGQDSTAAACLLPDDTIKVYCRRAYDGYFASNGAYVRLRSFKAERKALHAFKNVRVIPNNFELIGLSAGTRFGFRDHFGYGAVCLLLADRFDAGYVASGAPLEHAFLGSGNRYVDIINLPSSQHNALSRFFRQCGVKLTLPVGFISEVLTNAIVNASPYRGVAVSCPNVDEAGQWCGHCFKCFRKLRLDGRQAGPLTDSIRRALASRPLKNATSLLYAIRKAGDHIDEVAEYRDVDLEFLSRYHVSGFRGLLDERMRKEVGARLHDYGILPMSADDEQKLRRLGEIFTPDNFDPRTAGLTEWHPAATST